MKKLNKRERILLSIFLAILAISLGIQFILFPSLDKIKALKSERADLQMQWEVLDSYIGTESILQTRIEKLKLENDTLIQQLPPAQSSYLYWEFINKSAEQAGVNIVQLQEDQINMEGNNRLIYLSCTASLPEILSFIEILETMPYIHAVTEGSFQENGQLVTASLTLNISAHSNELN